MKLFPDREHQTRTGAQDFLRRVLTAVPATATPAARQPWASAIQALAQGEPLATVATDLANAWLRTLDQAQQALDGWRAAQAECRATYAELTQLQAAQEAPTWLLTLRADTATLRRQLDAAQAEVRRLTLARDAALRTVAARDVTIAELNALVAKQHLEFDSLFAPTSEEA
jgi:hypothetical protein